MKKVLFCFQQVGGANALLPFIEKLKLNYDVIITGRKLVCENLRIRGIKVFDYIELGFVDHINKDSKWFENILPNIVVTDTINLMRTPDGIVCRDFWFLAEKYNIPSIAYVDSWWGYKERFQMEMEKFPPVLPDQIAVVDDVVKDAMISLGFTECRISVLGSPRFEILATSLRIRDVEKINEIKKKIGLRKEDFVLVFVSQPIEKAMGSAEICGFTERTTICAIIEVLKELPKQIKGRLTLIIVPHPEDDIRELKKIVENNKPCFRFSFKDMKLSLDLIYIADLIVGMHSILLTEAVIMQRPVLSVQLNQKREEILATNMVGATTAIRTKEQLITLLSKAIIEESYRKSMLDRQKVFKIVPDASERWASKINYLTDISGR